MHELTFGALQYYIIMGTCEILTTALTLVLFVFTSRKNTLFIFYGLLTLVNLALFVQDAENTSGVVFYSIHPNPLQLPLFLEYFLITVLIMHKCLSLGAIVIMLYLTLEQYPTKHRYTAVAVAIIAIKTSTVLTSFTQEYLVRAPIFKKKAFGVLRI